MGLNPILEAAFANLDKWEAEQADDSSAPALTLVPTATKTYDAPDEISSDYVDEGDDTFAHVADVAAPMVRQAIKIRGLDEKAVLVSVKRRMYRPYMSDEQETKAYGAGNVNKHLFEGRDNRVKAALSAYTAVYSFVKDNTVPWTTGVDMLNIEHYFDFTSGLRKLIDAADDAVADLVANWQDEVDADMARLTKIAAAKGKPHLVNPNDYPSADEVAKRFGIEVRYMPVPTAGDFRVNISDEDKASLQQQLKDAEDSAAKHVIEQMLEPMQRAVEKLSVPIGTDGSIFRDSLIDNMVEVSDRMARVNVSDDPVITDKIADLRSLVSTYANNKDMLRSSQNVREKAAQQISALMGQMTGLV